ncbi:DUF368 domain-containing protein [Clostridium cagae]|uniref:Membrane protein n=1 Tax=Clostridium botulinum (strain Eklund 17B / Type B) TaxID=935198 RepID=B2TPJ5_CLOBB|nr:MULTISPECIES: DUF368 domain-containing protein [unclassified Clostridium]ACD24783.1 putative membrane protein [Clostridium botulinum B str. Eklund 17B (NRP)]MBN1046398.1 DUF368 domain-containing protein [Clostridium botulinum]MBN1053102.1 DUF368 domain-containing protein [Clostridium botulinum]MBN1056297.1 DUF368 domain-containing protein [Clostridium botulinum]MBN1068800.1 DUF368 domain-containing protein [Clostridium botulinum]
MYIINFIRGFCMALADSVPGVSGGTIAFILGFYDKFINSLSNVISGKKEEKIEAVKFLFKLGIGWVVGFVSSVLFLTSIFDKEIYKISSLFIGFIIFAIPIIIKEEKSSIINRYKNIFFSIIGVFIVVLISYFNPVAGSESAAGMSLDRLTLGLGIYIFIVAMIAISAMVLPGISGSTLLLIFGLYAPIMNAVKEVLKFNFDYLLVCFVFGFGVLFGILITIKGVKYLLSNYRSQTIYLILGLMIGSIYAVFMGPTSLEVPKPPMNLHTFNIIFFIIGGGIILLLQKLKYYLENKN